MKFIDHANFDKNHIQIFKTLRTLKTLIIIALLIQFSEFTKDYNERN